MTAGCDICEPGYWLNGTLCEVCKNNCLNCDDGTTCNKCKEGFVQNDACDTCLAGYTES